LAELGQRLGNFWPATVADLDFGVLVSRAKQIDLTIRNTFGNEVWFRPAYLHPE
jgi:hypothetical protein